jgi:ABC-type transport system involved in multi-copper enzyme maturation permease subunit
MSPFLAAFWAETLKARRSRVTGLTAAGFLILPVAGGLFMIILKNPEQARAWGLISTKAQLTAGVADWPAYLGILAQGLAGLGTILFAFFTAWVFGREFADHTVKELLALPTPRGTIVAAKFMLIALWVLAVTLLTFVIGLGVGATVAIPGWSPALGWTFLGTVLLTALLTFMLIPFAAFFASLGRGYLPPMGWTILVLGFANLVSVLGWGDWFPWAVPMLVSGMVRNHAGQVGVHSYIVVLSVFLAGTLATFAWWQYADQAV